MHVCFSQVRGCMDPLSRNYNPKATVNNGSCLYPLTKIKPNLSIVISKELNETSGLIAFKSELWTVNDDTDTSLYVVDTVGIIQNKIKLPLVSNKDWEEIAHDNNYIYLGDFGNNSAGNRKDLHILRIEKSTVETNPNIDTIAFSYSDQIDFISKKANKTDFDCEAFLVTEDSIYLFTKQWKSKKTSIYSLPKKPGKHIAQYKSSFDIKGLITGLTYLPEKKLIVLCGYNKRLFPFIYLLYGYENYNFFESNKRKIKLKLPFHQIEGIATFDGFHYFLSNEHTVLKPLINISQKLHYVDLSPYLKNFLDK
jgi:hypothetical protein